MGNEYVLMMVDQFTKWVECIPLPSQTAEVTAKAAVDHFFSRFGCPLHIFTDEGRNFESNLFKSLCYTVHIQKCRTTPHHPSSNGQVERYNRTHMNSVRCYIQGRQNRWNECVPQIAAALRASVNRSTGLSPNRLMLGTELTMPLELMFAPPKLQDEEDTPKETYVSGHETDIQEAHTLARETLSTTQRRMKADYDVKARSFRFAVGDAVYICHKASIKGRCNKLKSPCKGPALVLAVVIPYLLNVHNRNAVSVINHDHVKLCKDRILPK